AKVLVLVVAEDHDEVRTELVEPLAHAAKLGEHRRAMRGGGAEPVVASELREHLARPARAVLEWRRHAWSVAERLEDVGHVTVLPRERREVRHAESENRAHGRGLFALRIPPLRGTS